VVYDIRKVERNKFGIKLNGTLQRLVMLIKWLACK